MMDPSEHPASQARFKTIFELSPVGNKIIDSELNILQANMAMVKLLGYERKEEIVGTKILDFTPAEYQKDWKILQEQLWSHNSSCFSLESALVRRDGTLIRCRVTSILFEDDGKTYGYTTIEDVTEQYILRQQKDEFISVASHELKTPVTSLNANLQLLKRMMKPGEAISDRIVKLTGGAVNGVSRLMNLIDDLLSTTRLEHGEVSLNKGWFEIGELVEVCCNHVIMQGKYELIYVGDPSLRIYADQFKIEQVIVNLINNAVKYAPLSYKIELSAQNIDDVVKITVKDSGPGILEKDQLHLFDRYYRVVEAETSRKSGLGLGLYICAEIIKRHGGEIGVDSTEGSGASFWFTLPI
ncbi:MAG: ATP-binding protein [Bacteroidota bacterium]